jgi:hypothetical protein
MTRKPTQPDHVANPDKYTKYSLENVNEGQMSANTNRQAALDFLTVRKAAAGEVPKDTFQPEFNKGLNKMNKQQMAEIEEENEPQVERVVINADKDSEITFRRKGFNGKPNIRQKTAEAAEEENLAQILAASAKSEDKDELDKASTESELDSEESFDTDESSESGSFTDIRMAQRRAKPRKNYSELPESEELNDSDYDPSEDEEQENDNDDDDDNDEDEDENGKAEDELAVIKEKASEINQQEESDTESL